MWKKFLSLSWKLDEPWTLRLFSEWTKGWKIFFLSLSKLLIRSKIIKIKKRKMTDFNTLLPSIDRPTIQKFIKNIANLQYGLNIPYWYLQCHPLATKYVFFSQVHGKIPRMDRLSRHWGSISKLIQIRRRRRRRKEGKREREKERERKEEKIMPFMAFYSIRVKLEINHYINSGKHQNIWRLNSVPWWSCKKRNK